MMSARSSAWRILWLRPGAALRHNIRTQPLSIARHFASSAARCKAAKPPKRSARSSTSPSVRPPTRSPAKPAQDDYTKAGARTSHFGRLAARVAKEGEVILSKAPSQRVYLMISYSLTATCFACAAVYSPLLLGNTPDPLATWIKVLYGGVCVTMSALGTKFLLPTGRLIQHTTAVMAHNRTHVRFAVRRMVPFLKPRQLEALPQQITIERKLVISPESLERLQRGQAGGNGTHQPPSFFKMPIQRLSMMTFKFSQNVRQVFTNEDLILLNVEGQGRNKKLLLDSNGFVSKDFLSIGELVQTQRQK